MRVRTMMLRGVDGIAVDGARRAASGRLELDGDRALLPLSGPRRRTWNGVRLVSDVAVAAQEQAAGWAFAGAAEVDVLELTRDEASFSVSPPSTVLGAFTELADPSTVGRFLVAGEVLDPTSFGGARCPSEQTALGVYRVARSRGGAFWTGVAALVAQWTEERVRAGRLVHDLLGASETHTRFVADAVLLLAADGRADATRLALAQLDGLAVGDGPGRWWRHDSLEDGGDLVLNTHLLALLARRAAGVQDSTGVQALHAALAARPSRLRSWAHAADLATADLARGALSRRRVSAHAHAAEMRAARARQRQPHLVLPGGRTGRDVRPESAPAYHTVNTADLASYAATTGDVVVRRAALAAARYARASGHWQALRRDRDPVVLLVPGALLRLGQHRAAVAWADALRTDGWAPAIGWPGHVDQLWEPLPAGVP